MFDQKIARLAISKLKERGVPILDGLSEDEVAAIEESLGADIPSDLKIFFKEGIPVSESKTGEGFFPEWHRNIPDLVREMKADVEHAFIFDIENGDYWHTSFGSKPADTETAKEQALAVIRKWPPLIRVYGHRFMPTEPSAEGNPVLSVWQANDSVYYGYNLADYLQKEFEIELSAEVPKDPPRVPYWGDAFDLLSER